jgi:hypothetical protein
VASIIGAGTIGLVKLIKPIKAAMLGYGEKGDRIYMMSGPSSPFERCLTFVGNDRNEKCGEGIEL